MPSNRTTPVRSPRHAPRPPRRGWRHQLVRAAGAISDAPSRAPVRDRDRLYRRSLAVADAVAAVLALVLTVNLVGDDRLQLTALLVVPIAVATSKVIGLYDRDELLLHKTTLDEAPALFHVATLYALAAWLLEDLIVAGRLGEAQVVGIWGSLFGCTLLARAAARGASRAVTVPERCLVVGDADAVRRVRGKLESTHGTKAELVGDLWLDVHAERGATLRRIEAAVREHDVHRVILAPQAADTELTLDVIRLVKGLGVKVSLLPRVFEVVGSSVEFDDLDGLTVLGVRRFGLTQSSRLLKRALDFGVAAAALLAVAPLMLVAAIAIRLESAGPVLFRQVRVGRDGRRFEILKFRTMVDGADAMKTQLRQRNEADGLFKIADDPRVTRVGRLLRRTALDELPQLLNILRGEMSLVGPRPLVIDEDVKIEGWHRRRLHLTPGMTGHWQILGSARVPLHEMVKIDYLYIANWSFWGDVKILLRTVPYLVRRGGM